MNTLRSVNLNLLVVFQELLIEQSVSRAAKKLAMSQPAVSHALSRLRITLNDQLFIPIKGGIKPTLKALELQPALEKALYHATEVLNGPQQWSPSQMRRTFYVAMSDYGTALFLPEILSRMRKEAPNAAIYCLQAEHQMIASQLINGSVHFGFCIVDDEYKSLCSVPLYTERLICLISRDFYKDDDELTLESYLNHPHLVVSTAGTPYTDADAHLAKLGLKRKIGAVVPYYTQAAKAILKTDMILTIPYRLAISMFELSTFCIFEPPFKTKRFPYGLIWHPRSEKDRAVLWLRDIIVDVGKNVAQKYKDF